MPPRSSWILLWLLITFFTGSLRFVLRDLILSSNSVSASKLIRVAIYGAGTTGAQLASSLRSNGSHQIIAFLMMILRFGIDLSMASRFIQAHS